MFKEIYLVHHSHTDIGYTHPQPVVMELHRRFIDQALDYIDQTRDWPFESRFRWTCEVTGITLDWWNQAEPAQQARFLAAVERGQLEVAAAGWNMTPLMDHAMLLDTLKPIQFFRSLGIPVRSAMNSDVNGWPWGAVDALLDHGITGFSMAINPHFGYAPMPRPRGVWWEGASGRKLLVYNGWQYGVAAEVLMHIPGPLEEARQGIEQFAAELASQGLDQSFLMLQVTNPILYDNAGPRLELAQFVREWNQQGHPIRLRTATLSEVFDRLQAEPAEKLPTLRGDWTDWWNFGAGSTALETTMLMEGQRALAESRQLSVWPGVALPRQASLMAQAEQSLALYAEHTWGADRSIFKPLSSETRLQLGLKLAPAYQGLSLARMLRRDGLDNLAQLAGGREMTALFYNPLPQPVRRIVRIPQMDEGLEPYGTSESQAVHRQDVILGDMHQPLPPDTWHNPVVTRWVGPLEIPGLGYATWPYHQLPTPQGPLRAEENLLANERLEVRFDPHKGGITSLKLDGQEYARPGEWNFAQPVLEYPAGGTRREIFARPNWREPHLLQRNWKPDWQAVRQPPQQVLRSEANLQPGCAELVQVCRMTNGDQLTTYYRLFPGEASVEVETQILKVHQDTAHSLYLTMPLQLATAARCHFETAGAVVELDAEQLPNTSRHYITTQRFIRLQDGERGFTVACPDTPLWQVGGFTFGRHNQGYVERNEAMLLAWLTNNYWDTNFLANQGGLLVQRFTLIPHPAQDLAVSVHKALEHAVPPQLHWYAQRGDLRQAQASLLQLQTGGLVVTTFGGLEGAVQLSLLNPGDTPLTLQAAPGFFCPDRAYLTDLAGQPQAEVAVEEGRFSLEVAPRAWVGLRLITHRTGN